MRDSEREREVSTCTHTKFRLIPQTHYSNNTLNMYSTSIKCIHIYIHV